MGRLWDVFCRVIDNFGDIGVCWRLAADLAQRGESVRLWVDQAEPLRHLAPGALEGSWPGITVLPWSHSTDARRLASLSRPQIVVEGFGCEPDPVYLEWRFRQCPPDARAPHWINLEYLSAEPYVERSHGLPSPQLHGPARGHTRHFFYPGFTTRTGGLLRETDLARRQAAFDRRAWLAGRGLLPDPAGQVVSLFCYEPRLLGAWLDQRQSARQPTDLLVTVGRSAAAVAAALALPATPSPRGHAVESLQRGALRCHFLPWLTQAAFDELLWACDFNFVRGEDSVVRALWAGRPFVWQVYPQEDAAHVAKLEAFLDRVQAPPDWRAAHRAWNGLDENLPGFNSASWLDAVQAARARLLEQSDLTSRLLAFVEARPASAPAPAA